MKILTPDQYPGLPKWPGAFVTGKSVTPEQAKDIIFRTDTSVGYPSDYMGGNDRRFQERCIAQFGWKPLLDAEGKWFELHKIADQAEKEAAIELLCPTKYGFDNLWDVRNKWQEEMGMVATEYVHNSFLSSAYIGGPHGWCSPSGNIHSDGHNYGKWPGVETIVDDWAALVTAFPYIDVVCSLFSHEACQEERQPVCTIVIRDGKVVVCAPDLTMHDRNVEPVKEFDMGGLLQIMSGDYSYERGWPTGWVEEFGAKSTATMKKVAPWFFPES